MSTAAQFIAVVISALAGLCAAEMVTKGSPFRHWGWAAAMWSTAPRLWRACSASPCISPAGGLNIT